MPMYAFAFLLTVRLRATALLFMGAILLHVPPASAQCPLFRSSESYFDDAPPGVVLAKDLNRDGNSDLVTLTIKGRIRILLAKGDGTFAAPVPYLIENEPRSGAIGDFNSDGNDDLVTTTYERSTFAVLLGNGDGTFAQPVLHDRRPAGEMYSGAYLVAVADFDNDGKSDLAIAQFPNVLSVFSGNGDATFGDARTLKLRDGTTAIAVADFNRDGIQDFATADGLGNLSILLGRGDGTFQGRSDYGDSTGTESGREHFVAVGAFGGDSAPDIVIAGPVAGVRLLTNNGDGTFTPAIRFANTERSHVTTADFNGDDWSDVLTANVKLKGDEGNVSIYLGAGNGTLTFWRQIAGIHGPQWGAVGDFNNDHTTDFAIVSRAAVPQVFSGVSVFVNDPSCKQRPACPSMEAGKNISVTFLGTQSGCKPSGGICSAGEVVKFTAAAANGYDFDCDSHSFVWSFGDGTTSTFQNPTKIYTKAGNFSWSVRVVRSTEIAVINGLVNVRSKPNRQRPVHR